MGQGQELQENEVHQKAQEETQRLVSLLKGIFPITQQIFTEAQFKQLLKRVDRFLNILEKKQSFNYCFTPYSTFPPNFQYSFSGDLESDKKEP